MGHAPAGSLSASSPAGSHQTGAARRRRAGPPWAFWSWPPDPHRPASNAFPPWPSAIPRSSGLSRRTSVRRSWPATGRPAAERRRDLSRAARRHPGSAHVDRLRPVLLGGRRGGARPRGGAGRAEPGRGPGQRAARRRRHAGHAGRAGRHAAPQRLSRRVVPATGALERPSPQQPQPSAHPGGGRTRGHHRRLGGQRQVDGQRPARRPLARHRRARSRAPPSTWLQAAFIENWRVATGELLRRRGLPRAPAEPPATYGSRSSAARRPAAATRRTRWSCWRSPRPAGRS